MTMMIDGMVHRVRAAVTKDAAVVAAKADGSAIRVAIPKRRGAAGTNVAKPGPDI